MLSNSSNNNNKKISSQSQSEMGDKKYDTIPFRLEFIKELLNGKNLDPMIDVDANNTEYFTNPNGYKNMQDNNNNNDGDEQSQDTTYILNKKIHDFYKVINQIGGKLMYIKSGTTGHTFRGITSPESGLNISYAVKVVAYPKREKYGNMNDISRPENAELMMIRLLSYFVVKRQTPHIVLPIGTFNTSIKPFLNLITNNVVAKDNKKYLEFIERYNKQEYYDQVSILISEWANRGDMLDFIRKNYKEFTPTHWKVIFFQVISTLAVIQSKFPAFRHNDLKANNILIHKINPKGKKFCYTVNKKKYIVPSIGYIIKLWDFDFACIPGVVNNAKVSAKWTDEINVKPVQNRYYDMHYFFNTLIKKGFFPQFIEESCVPKEAKEFVNRIVPMKLQSGDLVTKRGRIVNDTEYLLPVNVLETDPFFEEFRKGKFAKSTKLTIKDRKVKKNI